MDFNEALIYSIVIGGIIGVIWGLRRLVLLERKLLNIEQHVEKIVESIEKEEQQKKLEQLKNYLSTQEELENKSYNQRLEQLRLFEENGTLTAQEAATLREDLQKKHQGNLLDIAAKGQGAMLQANVDFIKSTNNALDRGGAQGLGVMTNALGKLTSLTASENKKMFEINKAAGIANAIVSTAQGVAGALRYLPFPANIAAAGIVGAAGAAQVAAISSTTWSML